MRPIALALALSCGVLLAWVLATRESGTVPRRFAGVVAPESGGGGAHGLSAALAAHRASADPRERRRDEEVSYEDLEAKSTSLLAAAFL